MYFPKSDNFNSKFKDDIVHNDDISLKVDIGHKDDIGQKDDIGHKDGIDHKAGHKNILVLSTARSGSTFTGDVLTHYPETYYSSEPSLIYSPHGKMVSMFVSYSIGPGSIPGTSVNFNTF